MKKKIEKWGDRVTLRPKRERLTVKEGYTTILYYFIKEFLGIWKNILDTFKLNDKMRPFTSKYDCYQINGTLGGKGNLETRQILKSGAKYIAGTHPSAY